MSTLDEITKEKQRVSEALARVDEQREKLTSQLGELDATERVPARYSKGRPATKTAAAKTPTTATKAAAPAHAAGAGVRRISDVGPYRLDLKHAEEPVVCMTLRWREMDSNHQYLEDKRRFVQRLRLCRVFDESLATARFFTPLGIIARNLSGR